ncbi:hypothetical protein [Desulfosporosinus meridiei]|uniref:Spore coat protein U domain-containing protein n=1 Tax=Desulfosporosinus meridiei (strain ATCC BAA-275 / DSM 13257 / KCTC 12902 / NCIMB 13706 / S10) TaxID=768704 RepID=J7ISY1_DESMD|nr:hypothetical protein [Desulfosporosinus meridiei]AFQ42238.1 hypothetical protein Desmer_0171 [Desulfosporosinus meridiei DSM 13257]
MKKLIPILLTVIMLLGTQVALGATASKPSSSGVIRPAAFQTISDGQCSIVDNGDGTIKITGSTSTYYAVDEIGLKLSLQCYSEGKWTTLSNYSYNKYSTDYVYGGKAIGVSRGYNYRVVAQHSSLDGGMNEGGQSYSDSIYIQ